MLVSGQKVGRRTGGEKDMLALAPAVRTRL